MYNANRFDCPAVNATAPSAKVSDRYRFVSTKDILELLTDNGFAIARTWQGRTDSSTAKHIVELEDTRSAPIEVAPGDFLKTRVALVNSHDRSTAFCLHAGAFRAYCANGMVFGGKYANTIKFKHLTLDNKTAQDDFIEGVWSVVWDARDNVDKMKSMARHFLDPNQEEQFAERAMALRWSDGVPQSLIGLTPQHLLECRRRSDEGTDLFRTYQRVQEGLLRGGARVLGVVEGQGGRRHRMSRVLPVNQIDKSISINGRLWELAVETLKAA